MKVGKYEIPDLRLIPTAVETLGEIYKFKKRERMLSKDLAILLGFKYGTETHFYRKLRTLIEYGLIEGNYQISDLGERILYPRNDMEREVTKTKAVLHVELWKAIYQKHGKSPSQSNFWAVLADVAKIDPATAKENDSKIYKWYIEDISNVSDNLATQNIETDQETGETKSLISMNSNQLHMSQQVMENPHQTQGSSMGRLSVPSMGTIEINDEDTLTIARSYLSVLEKKIKEKKSQELVHGQSSEVLKPTQ